MKKLICTLFALAMCASLAACGGDEGGETTNSKDEQAAATTTDSAAHEAPDVTTTGSTTTNAPDVTTQKIVEELVMSSYVIINGYLNETHPDANVELYELLESVKSKIGDKDIAVKLIDKILTAMITGQKRVVDFGQTILVMDFIEKIRDPYTEPNFIDENTYAYLSISANIHIVYNFQSDTYGVYNSSAKSYVQEPSFDFIAVDDTGYIAVGKDGYYGCLNDNGEKTIGFIYEEPFYFNDDLAVVCVNGKYGIINTEGTIVLETKYRNASILEEYDFIIADNSTNSVAAYAMYDYSGKQLTTHSYSEINYYDGRIYALNNTKTPTGYWYDLYDRQGNPLIGEGSKLPWVRGVLFPGNFGISIAECDSAVTNTYGIEYPIYGPYYDKYWYTYLDKELKPLNDGVYQCVYANYKMSNFNQKGYAIASIQRSEEGSKQTRVVLDLHGNELSRFENSYMTENGWDFLPIDANDYLYNMCYISFSYQYAIYIRSTGELIRYDWIKMLEGTNLTIVSNSETALYGLYDGEELVLNMIYNSIEYVDGIILAKQGAEQIEYTPVY